MKKLSSIFIAIAVFCFVAFTSCQGSTSTEPAQGEEMVEEAATEIIEEEVDSSATEEMAGEGEMMEDAHEH